MIFQQAKAQAKRKAKNAACGWLLAARSQKLVSFPKFSSKKQIIIINN
jgi:hypothetical protein